MKVFILILLLLVITALMIYDVRVDYDNYDILLHNRFTKLGFGIDYKEDFEIWHFAHTTRGGKAEKRFYPSLPMENRTDEIVENMFNVAHYFNGYETTYKQWKPLISKLSEYNIDGNNPGLFDSLCFFEAYTRELEEKYNTSLDMGDTPLSEVNEYFAERAEKDGHDILVTTLIEDFYVEKGLLHR